MKKSSVLSPYRPGHVARKGNNQRESPLEARRRNRAWIQQAVTECLEVEQQPEEVVTWIFAPLLQLIKYARDNNLKHGILSQRFRLVSVNSPVNAPVSGLYKINIETKAYSFTLNFGLTNDPQERDLMQKIWRRCFLLQEYLPRKAAIRKALETRRLEPLPPFSDNYFLPIFNEDSNLQSLLGILYREVWKIGDRHLVRLVQFITQKGLLAGSGRLSSSTKQQRTEQKRRRDYKAGRARTRRKIVQQILTDIRERVPEFQKPGRSREQAEEEAARYVLFNWRDRARTKATEEILKLLAEEKPNLKALVEKMRETN